MTKALMTGARRGIASFAITLTLVTSALANPSALIKNDAETPASQQPEARGETIVPVPPSSAPFSQAPDSPKAAPASTEERAGRIQHFRAIARIEAEKLGLPPAMADAVMRVESNYNPNARGKDGEYGLMQIMPPTARLLGLQGPVETLSEPETNIRLGVKYLAGAWRLGKGDICTVAMKYRAGHGENRFSVLSVRYCERVRQHLASVGYPVTGSIPEPTFGFRSDITRMGIAIGTQQAAKRLASGKKLKSRANWASYDTRMRALDQRGKVSLGGL
ncbi:MAG: lytic transglycosylase domain-containing protein [Beijerinckiaceae bacterium]